MGDPVGAPSVGAFEVTVADGTSGTALTAWIRAAGRDVVAVVGGGERPHVGVVVVAQPYPSRSRPGRWSASTTVLTVPPHKEEPIARRLAERLSRETGAIAVVTAGVHDDDLDSAGIRSYVDLAGSLEERVAAEVRAAWGEPPAAPER